MTEEKNDVISNVTPNSRVKKTNDVIANMTEVPSTDRDRAFIHRLTNQILMREKLQFSQTNRLRELHNNFLRVYTEPTSKHESIKFEGFSPRKRCSYDINDQIAQPGRSPALGKRTVDL